MTEEAKREQALTGLFAAFMFLQFTVLWLGNHAGEGLLSAERRELVYYGLQVFVILGYLAYVLHDRFFKSLRKGTMYGVLGLFLAGGTVMLAGNRGTYAYLIITLAEMVCLGYVGAAVYHLLSKATAAGVKTARCMGFGGAAAVILQYVLQLRWGITPLLPAFMLVSFAWLGYILMKTEPPLSESRAEPTSNRKLLSVVLITMAFLLFVSFYNGYIHHLQILSGYTDYNVYSWPRLMMVPCYLLFAFIGDRKGGSLVPLTALCIALTALLNSVLTGSSTYTLNMCLFYCAIAASASYYNLTFWRLAPRTGHPALWASSGRMLDSAMVLFTGMIRISTLPAAAVLAVNIAGNAVIILLMALGGDFNLTEPPGAIVGAVEEESRKEEPAEERPALLSGDDALARMQERYALTARETEVLRELVLTEDKQTVISERLSIRVKTLQDYVTRLYRKTGAATRSGLTELYHRNMRVE